MLNLNAEIGKVQNRILYLKNETPVKSIIHLKICDMDSQSLITKCTSFITHEKKEIVLECYEIQKIDLRFFNTMWGVYNHTVEISALTTASYKIPIQVNVSGTPVKIHTEKVFKGLEEISLIRYLIVNTN